MNIEIYILTHKEIDESFDESLYLPLLNGAVAHDQDWGYIRDDSGENISSQNIYYAEMTGEYWVWKNSDADIIGFCHYRRYFAKNIFMKKLEEDNIKNILADYDIILPNIAHLGMTHIEDIEKTRKYSNYGPFIEEYHKLRLIIKKYYPDYLQCYDEFLNQKDGYGFNMFICKKEIADDYFKWVFDILEKVKEEIDFNKYPDNQRRILGFLSERLLNVYVMKNGLKIKEQPVLISDRKIPLLYVIGYRFSIIVRLFKFIAELKYKLKKQ